MKDRFEPVGLKTALTANALVVGVFIYAWVLENYSFDLYRAAVQEDEYLEWATFWGFIVASAVFVLAAVRQRRVSGGVPWFEAGLGVFCFLFAMEEISWAQRIFAYRPPTYFLEHNFQQEPNFHNVISTDLRMGTLKAIIGVYGVILPVLVGLGRSNFRRLLHRTGVVVPPMAFSPSFALAYWVFEDYPWKYSGEIVELMLAVAFLCVSLVVARRAQGDGGASEGRTPLVLAGASLAVIALGLATAAAVRNQQSIWPENIELATTETEALRADFLALSNLDRERFPTKCGTHKRIYSFVEKYKRDDLRQGSFGALQSQGMAEERAEFFIDPWNAPYWVRDRCRKSSGRRTIFVYSFGPNRRRESSEWEVLGDDIGTYIYVDSGDREED